MPPKRFRGKHIFIPLLEDGTLVTQEEDGQKNSLPWNWPRLNPSIGRRNNNNNNRRRRW
jgi:hypothetical protein